MNILSLSYVYIILCIQCEYFVCTLCTYCVCTMMIYDYVCIVWLVDIYDMYV